MDKASFMILVFACFFSCIVGGVAFAFFMSIYKDLINLRKMIKLSWSKIDSNFKQRQKDLSQLIQIASQIIGSQQVVIKKIIALQVRFKSAKRLSKKIKLFNEIYFCLRSFFALAEAYPELKNKNDFLKIKRQFSDFELQVLSCSKTFNQHIELYNSKVAEMPDSVLAKLLGYHELDRIMVEESDGSLKTNNLNLAA